MSAGQRWRGILTERQAEVTELVAQGMLNKEIAIEMDLREQTVKFHIQGALQRAELTNRTALAVWWLREIERSIGCPIPDRWEGSD